MKYQDILDIILKDDYTGHKADFSASSLANENIQDELILKRLKSLKNPSALIGTAVHHYLEEKFRKADSDRFIQEIRLDHLEQGYIFSGCFDLYDIKTGILYDFKRSDYRLDEDMAKKNTYQLNIYKFLIEKYLGFKVTGLVNIYIEPSGYYFEERAIIEDFNDIFQKRMDKAIELAKVGTFDLSTLSNGAKWKLCFYELSAEETLSNEEAIVLSLSEELKRVLMDEKALKEKKERLRAELNNFVEGVNACKVSIGGINVVKVPEVKKKVLNTSLLSYKYPKEYQSCMGLSSTKAHTRVTVKNPVREDILEDI